MKPRRWAAGAGCAVAVETALVWLSVHPAPWTARFGSLPLVAALWATFAAAAWLARRGPARAGAALIILGGMALQLAALSAPRQGSETSTATSGTAACRPPG